MKIRKLNENTGRINRLVKDDRLHAHTDLNPVMADAILDDMDANEEAERRLKNADALPSKDKPFLGAKKQPVPKAPVFESRRYRSRGRRINEEDQSCFAIFATDRSTGKEYCDSCYNTYAAAKHNLGIISWADREYNYGKFDYRIEEIPDYSDELYASSQKLNRIKLQNHEKAKGMKESRINKLRKRKINEAKKVRHWTDAYKEFEKIVDKYWPNQDEIESMVYNLAMQHYGESAWDKAYDKWVEGNDNEELNESLNRKRTRKIVKH